MVRVSKLLVLAAVCGVVVAAGPEARAEGDFPVQFSGNVSLVSNYVWRGMTQTNNHPAVQGGFDTQYMGFYAGVWGSSIETARGRNDEASTELDLYGGFYHDVTDWLNVDVGFISYQFPGASGSHFEEVYGGLNFTLDMVEFGATYGFGLDEGADFVNPMSAGDDIDVSASTELFGFGLAAGWGDYEDFGSRASGSISRSFAGLDWGVDYVSFDGDEDNGRRGQDNWVFSVSRNL